jgi:hypothetical protein
MAALLIGTFWWGSSSFGDTYASNIETIMEILKKLGLRMTTPERIEPKFFVDLLLLLADMSNIYYDP